MSSAFKFWQKLLSRKQKNIGRIKSHRLLLDFETLENRYGPTPGIEMGLSVMGFAFANPLGIGARTDAAEISAAPDSLSSPAPRATDLSAWGSASIESAPVSTRSASD